MESTLATSLVFGFALGVFLGLPALEAIYVSMISVGAMAAVYVLLGLSGKDIDVRLALLLALPGFVAAPIGAWAGTYFNTKSLLLLFSVVLLVTALSLWKNTASAREIFRNPGEKEDRRKREFVF